MIIIIFIIVKKFFKLLQHNLQDNYNCAILHNYNYLKIYYNFVKRIFNKTLNMKFCICNIFSRFP